MDNKLPVEYAKETCKLGQGSNCCRYLILGSEGFECAKLTSLKATLDARGDTMNAQGDNCRGKGEQTKKVNHPILGEIDVIQIEGGDRVVCDYCNADYSHSDKVGGILFGSYAICPLCSVSALKTIARYQEEHYIKARAGENETFYNFVQRIRQ